MVKGNRTISSVIVILAYIIVFSLTYFVHKMFFDVFIMLLMIYAGLEVSKALKNKFSKPVDLFIVLYVILGYIVFKLAEVFIADSAGALMWYFAALIIVGASLLIYCMFSKVNLLSNAATTMLVLIYPTAILAYMLGLNYLGGADNLNTAAILLLFLISAFTDTGAYLIGSLIKGPKLCPSISPKKTISGAVGGLLGGIVASSVVLILSVRGVLGIPVLSQTTALNVVHYLLIGLFGAAFTQLGDLAASYIKRQCNVKDFGKILPGHGGLMDRIDGMTFLAVFLYIYITVLFV